MATGVWLNPRRGGEPGVVVIAPARWHTPAGIGEGVGVGASPRMNRRAASAALLAVAVALAFADSSIVMLGLPEIYGELDATIPGVSFVITAYNLVVAVVAFALVPVLRRVRPGPILTAGLVVFIAASLGCGLVSDLPMLVTLRGVQGLGAAMLLAASLPALVALTGGAESGRRVWALAGSLGAVLGPAAGGIITELADWRAIFIAQAPLAALALVAAADPRVRGLQVEPGPVTRRPLWPAFGLVFAFGALVGALFLAVLMIVTVWGLGPLAGAIVVSALPIAAVAVSPLAGRVGPAVGSLAGAPLLAAGLIALALLPAVSAWWAAAALAVCGAGFGLLVPPLTWASVGGGSGALAVAGTLSVGARHVGLVAALVIVAPLLAVDLDEGGDRATHEATRVILDARLGLQQKIPVALDLAEEFDRTPRGAVPDLGSVFDQRGADDDENLRRVRDGLVGAIEASLTRSFRASYLVSAAFALLALVPVAFGLRAMRGVGGRRAPPVALAGLAVVAAAAGALIVAELASGGEDLGRSRIADPCATRVSEGGGGFDATIQGVVLDGLAGAACELGVTREDLVLSFGPDVGTPRIPWSSAQVDQAVRAGLVRAIDDAEDRGSLNSFVADILRGIARRAPIDEIIRGAGAISDLTGRIRDLDAGDVLDTLRGLAP